MRTSAVLALLLLVPVAAFAVPFTGTVEDREGKVPGHVVISVEPLSESNLNFLDLDVPRKRGLEQTKVDDEGRFTIDIPSGAHRVWFQAPHHKGHSVILFVGPGDKKLPNVHVALGRTPPIEWFGTPAVLFRDGTKRSDPIELKREEDGTWTLQHPTDAAEMPFVLQLNTREGREWTANPGTPVTFDGRFYSVAESIEGRVSIRFDPKMLEPVGRERAEVKFADPNSVHARLHELASRFERSRTDSDPKDRAMDPKERTQIVREADAVIAPLYLERMNDRRASKLERELAARIVLELFGGVDDAARKRARALLPPTSMAWSAIPPAMQGHVNARLGGDAEATAFLKRVARTHPDPAVRGGAVYALARRAKEEGREKEAKRLMQEVRVKYADHDTVKWGLMRETRKRSRGAGEPFPDLKLATLDGKPVNAEAFTGRHTFLDFSAYGCGPCESIIPELQELRTAYPEDRLRMVTITLGTTPKTLKELLAKQPPQPWDHVALPDSDEFLKTYESWEVTYYPTLFLVGPDGKIVAVDEDLRKGYPSRVADRVKSYLPVDSVSAAD